MGEESKKHCLCCGEQVETSLVERYGKTEVICIYCGFVIDHQTEGEPEERRAEAQEPPPGLAVMVAEDSEATRKLIEVTLRETGLVSDVAAFADGKAFTKAASEVIKEGGPLDVIILDIEMPVMDGFTAARILRSLEEKFDSKRHPIIFFSSRKADAKLKKEMAPFAPARYLNKGSIKDPDDLMERVKVLVSRLEEMAQKS